MRTQVCFGVALCFALFAAPGVAQDAAVFVEDFRFGTFISASNIEVDPFGMVYVSDAGTHMLGKFTSDGQPLAFVGGRGWGVDEFDHPSGIDAQLGIVLYVADRENHRVIRLDKNLHAVGSFSTKNAPSPELSFGSPRDVVLTSMGNLLVLDGENGRICSTSGFAIVEQSFGGVESGEGRLRSPIALSRFTDDRITVLESDRICMFDAFGNYIFSTAYNIFEDARGIACHKNRVAVVTPSELHIFKADGTLEKSYTRNRFVFAGETGAFQDVAMTDTRMYILTAKSVLVFTFKQ